MQVEQIDFDAADEHFDVWYPETAWGYEPLAEAFARHRHKARTEVVGEIVAELRALHWTHRDAEPAKRIADLIEAKFGGRDASDD